MLVTSAAGFIATQQFDNVVVLRTFSKVYGLAGIRVGYGVMREELAGYYQTIEQGPADADKQARREAERRRVVRAQDENAKPPAEAAAAYEDVVAAFGTAVLAADGTIDRTGPPPSDEVWAVLESGAPAEKVDLVLLDLSMPGMGHRFYGAALLPLGLLVFFWMFLLRRSSGPQAPPDVLRAGTLTLDRSARATTSPGMQRRAIPPACSRPSTATRPAARSAIGTRTAPGCETPGHDPARREHHATTPRALSGFRTGRARCRTACRPAAPGHRRSPRNGRRCRKSSI